ACTARSRSFGANARARATSSSALGMAFFGGASARVSATLMRVSPGFLEICTSLRQGVAANQAHAVGWVEAPTAVYEWNRGIPRRNPPMIEQRMVGFGAQRRGADVKAALCASTHPTMRLLRLDLRLVPDARQAFGAAEHRQHVKDPGRGGAAGQC